MNKQLLSYGLLGFPLAILGIPLYVYLPTFYVSHLSLSITLVGIVLFLSRIIDMLFDPFIGLSLDNYQNKKLFILISSVCLLICFYFLVFPKSGSGLFYLFLFSLLTYISWSFITITYFSYNASLAKDETQTNKYSFSREVFTIMGLLTALLIPYLFNVSSDAKMSMELLYILVLLSLPIVLVFFIKNIKELNTKKQDKNYSFKEYKYLINKEKKLFFAFLSNALANAIASSIFLFYVNVVLNLKEQAGLFLIVYFLCALLSFILWVKLADKFSKKRLWISSMIIASLTFCFVPFLGQNDFYGFLIVCVLTGITLSADLSLPTAIQADITKKYEKENFDISGVFFGFWAMLTKLALSLSVLITFVVLGIFSFDETNPSAIHTNVLIFLYSFLPILFKSIAMYYLYSRKDIN